nr:UDP-N-acetylmuramate dehydrogenase [uncultured Capnocytophaga sp.]
MLIPNTFNIKAEADTYLAIRSERELIEALKQYSNPFVLGGGSNMLLTTDVTQPVFHILLKGITIVKETDDEVWLKAQAGENWHSFVMHTLELGYGGLENLALIYGNVGTAPVQNIGAYGVEIKDVMYSCEAINVHTQEKRIFTTDECDFAYRESVFKGKEKGNYIITSVTFKLSKHNHHLHTQYGAIQEKLAERGITQPTPKQVAEVVISIRESKLPNPAELGNSGSFFKNPIILTDEYQKLQQQYPDMPSYTIDITHTKVPAGWLIDRCGLKGYRQGDAGVHTHQALVLVNYGKATGQEVLALAHYVKEEVTKKFGITLEFEVNIF